MAAEKRRFTFDEASRVMRQRVRLVKRMGSFPAGLTGRVVARHPTKLGFFVEVKWDGFGPCYLLDFEYFTKDEFDEYLTEC
jgi:hypothetical protein